MANPKENQVGLAIEYQCVQADGVTPLDVSGATRKNLVFKKPNRVRVTKAAAFVTDGTDGLLKYVTETGFLTPAGIWEYEADVAVTNVVDGRIETKTFTVDPIL